MDLKEEAILGEHVNRHWYYRAKFEAMLHYLGPGGVRNILDVGAGSGFFSKELLVNTQAASALCIDPDYEREADESLNTKPLRYRRGCGVTNADLVLMMDVLEHVEDDVGLLQEYLAKVPTGARFLITVPAFSWLWSEHDVFLGHKRRYSLAQLRTVVSAAGLEIQKSSYYFGLVFPLAAAVRLSKHVLRQRHAQTTSDLKQHGFLVNSLLYTLCHMELGLLNFNHLLGLSVFCLARKTSSGSPDSVSHGDSI